MWIFYCKIGWLRVLFHDFFCLTILLNLLFFDFVFLFYIYIFLVAYNLDRLPMAKHAHIIERVLCACANSMIINDMRQLKEIKNCFLFNWYTFINRERSLFIFLINFFFILKNKLIIWDICVIWVDVKCCSINADSYFSIFFALSLACPFFLFNLKRFSFCIRFILIAI